MNDKLKTSNLVTSWKSSIAGILPAIAMLSNHLNDVVNSGAAWDFNLIITAISLIFLGGVAKEK